MKKPYLILLFLLFCVHANQAKQITFENPIPVKFGDPYILKASDNRYYMVGTGGVKDGFKMYSSTDLKEWKDEGRIYQGNTGTSWDIANFWAPELYEYQGKFYLLFSANWCENATNELENFRIGVAVSDIPTGMLLQNHHLVLSKKQTTTLFCKKMWNTEGS